MGEENDSQYISDSGYGLKLMRRTMIFLHTNTTHLMKKIKTRRMDMLKIGNGNLSQMI